MPDTEDWYQNSLGKNMSRYTKSWIWLPPEIAIQLPALKQLSKKHLEICPDLWKISPVVAQKLLSYEEFNKIPGDYWIDGRRSYWASDAYIKQRSVSANVFGFNNLKEVNLDPKLYVHDDQGRVIYSESGANHKDYKQSGKLSVERMNVIMKVMPTIQELKYDLETFERKVLAGEPVNVSEVYDSFTRNYSKIKKYRGELGRKVKM